uniref:XPG-I domain-containing protein n=1 Tax=Moniliophthora roreri TaxID=221103 RepID=A0A0W0F790_MONRR
MPLFSQPLCSAMDINSGHDTDISMALPSPPRPNPVLLSIQQLSNATVNNSVPTNAIMSKFVGLGVLIGTKYLKLGIDFAEEANDDLEGEQEALPALSSTVDAESDEEEDRGELQTSLNSAATTPATNDVEVGTGKGESSKYKDVVKEYSKGVTPGTVHELMKQLTAFLVKHEFIKPSEEFFGSTPHEDLAYMIVAWIVNSCNAINLDGTVKPNAEYRQTFNHAQRMCAAATFGKMVGNPSVLQQVSLYMVSLCQCKIHAGENDATSARAISHQTLHELYNYNTHPDRWTVKPLEQAPGKAEAELAECNARGILDCVLSNNIDTLIFGAQHVACLTKPDTHKDDIIIYLAVAIENNDRLGLNHKGLILIASVSGRDYHKGIEHAGIQTGIALACAGYGSSLAAIY